jgi:hypothetical protein
MGGSTSFQRWLDEERDGEGQTDVSTKHAAPQEGARLPGEDEHEKRPLGT